MFDRSNNRKRKPLAVRRTGAARVGDKTKPKIRLSIGMKDLALPATFLAALGCGWLALSWFQPRDNRISWQACLENQQGVGLYPNLVEIPAGTYEVPENSPTLTPFLLFHDKPNIVLQNSVLLQNKEVDREQLKHYADAIDRLQDFDEKERLRLRLGSHWDHNDVQDSLVRHITWEGAWDYSQWLSRKTGCDYRLPSRDEWAAAAIFLTAQGQAPVNAQVNAPVNAQVNGGMTAEEVAKNVLLGAREWSQSPCPDGYFLLGGDDWTASADDKKEICMPAILAMAGFRLVLNPSSIPGLQVNSTQTGGSLKMDEALSLEKVNK